MGIRQKILTIFTATLVVVLCVASADGRRRSSKDVKQERQKTERQIARTRDKIKQNDKETSRQLNRLNTLKANMALTGDTIKTIKTKLDSINSSIKTVNDSIGILTARAEALKANYAKTLRTMRTRRQGMSDLSFIFSAKSFSQAWRRIRYLREIAQSSTRQAKRVEEATLRLADARAQLDKLRETHAAALSRLNATQAKMATEQKKADRIVTDLRRQGKSLNRELQRRREQSEKLRRELDRIIEQEAREAAERARREAEEAARKKAEEDRKAREAEEKRQREEEAARKKAETGKKKKPDKKPKKQKPEQPQKPNKAKTPGPVKPPSTPRQKPGQTPKLSSNFAENKGKLLFPVAGRYIITSNFGTNDHPELSKVKIDNPGIDIEVASGTSARAVFDGMVTYIFRLDGYHNIVIVRHGEYLTVYGGIDRLAVKKGDKVAMGQTIGGIYSDPTDDNRTVLHFEIRHEKRKLNPTEWVR